MLAFLRGIGVGWLAYGLGRDISWVKVTVTCTFVIVIAGNLTGARHRDEILRPVAVPFVQQHHLIFQQDNARPHVARVCQDFLANHRINPLD
jgi:hypothetical protein